MRSRKEGSIVIFITLLLLIVSNVWGQPKFNISGKFIAGFSELRMNKLSIDYKQKWESVNTKFSEIAIWGAGIGVSYSIKPRFKLLLDLRYMKWGGDVKADKGDPTVFFDYALRYQSFNIPVGVRYDCIKRKGANFFFALGLGLDYTFKTNWIYSNYYTKQTSIDLNSDIRSFYTCLATGIEKKFTEKVNGQLSVEWNTDYLFNSGRTHYTDYFSSSIPLQYNLIALVVAMNMTGK